MDLLLNDEEETTRATAREFLEGESPTHLVRSMELDPLGYPPHLWKQIAQLDWIGLCLPEQYGGQGFALTHAGLLLEEIGRHVTPIPLHSTVVTALLLAKYGSPDLCARILPGVCEGSAILTYAFQEGGGGISARDIAVSAQRSGDEFVLNGTKSFVDNFAASSQCLVVCRLSVPAESGGDIVVVLVDSASSGITHTPLITTAKDKQGIVSFDNVRVPVGNVLGAGLDGWVVARDLLDHAVVLLCAQMAGATRKDAEMAFEYAKQRHAFGHPIGAFQSIQHLCADMLMWTDGAQLLTYEALWRLGEGIPASVEVSQAKSFASEKCVAVCRSSQQIHGGIGFMQEFDLQLWYRRVVAWSLRLGNSVDHRRRISTALFDAAGELRLGQSLTLDRSR
jgi:alkylation response protein AidB-like acyl-CoA dehydrogenase